MKPGQIMARLKAPLGAQAMAERDAAVEHEAEAPRPRQGSKARARRASIAAHPAFVPLVSLWGTALFGLAMLVLPPAATARVALLTGLDALGGTAHFVLAALAALGGGALAFGIARALSRRVRAKMDGPAIIRSARRRASSGTAGQDTDPINPREELGSDSLDAPLEEMPLGIEAEEWLEQAEPAQESVGDSEPDPDEAPEPAAAPQEAGASDAPESVADAIRRRLARVTGGARGLEAGDGSATEAGPAEPEPEPESAPTGFADAESGQPESVRPASVEPESGGSDCVEPESGASAPCQPEKVPPALDLAEFGALPGRNAVWVEGPLPEGLARADGAQAATPRAPSPESPAQSPARSTAGSSATSAAIARLRATPAEDLSLVQMVERLAAALHERQAADAARPRAAGARDDAERDAALAEALKALGDLAGDRAKAPGSDDEAGETGDLAAALARLHDMRGAA